MKIVAGMGNVEDYPAFIEAGADEVFCGIVPEGYIESFGRFSPINRREVVYYNVQLGAYEELRILSDMKKKLGGSCTIAVNAPVYTPDQRTEIRGIVTKLIHMGYKDFIVAEEALIGELYGTDIQIHVSGEYGELNSLVVKHLEGYNPGRIIFPRQTEIAEMKSMISHSENIGEFEAFVLNEKCHFTGAYCSSRHCDELCHMCRAPYRLSGGTCPTFDYYEQDETVGATGCGLCGLWDLRDAGITHLKLVSRGNDSESTVRDIRALKQALEILESADTKEHYIKTMKDKLFPEGCLGNCYY